MRQRPLARMCHVGGLHRNMSLASPILEPGQAFDGSASAAGAKRPISSAVPITLDKWWEDSTATLLDRDLHPVGSFDTLLWHKAETVILYWADRGSEGLSMCLRTLDRLAEEAVVNPMPQCCLHVYVIHAILGSWKKQFQKYQSKLLPSQILEKLEGYLSKAPGLFEPNIATYTMILDGASYCPDPVERIDFSESLLARLLEESVDSPALRPSEVTIGTVLKAWSKSGSIQGAHKAEELLRRIIELRKEEQWKYLNVNTIHYTTVLNAYANAGEPEHAQRLLREMFEESLVHGNSEVQPNIRSFNAVLSAWSKTSAPDAFQSAEELLVRMGELYENGALEGPPDTISYNCVLNTLAKNVNRVPDAVEKAESLVNNLLKRLASSGSVAFRPTVVTFTALVRIIAASNLPDKSAKATYWLEKAKELGVTDERFLLDQFQTRILESEKAKRQ